MKPKQLARKGAFYMREAILDVLFDRYAESSPHGIGAAEVSRLTGIYRGETMNDAVVGGFLFEMEGIQVVRVKQANGQGGWRLTDDEFERRREGSQGLQEAHRHFHGKIKWHIKIPCPSGRTGNVPLPP